MKTSTRPKTRRKQSVFPAWIMQIGTPVRAYSIRGQEESAFETKTRSDPWQLGDGTWVVLIEGKTGGWACDALKPLKTVQPSKSGKLAPKISTVTEQEIDDAIDRARELAPDMRPTFDAIAQSRTDERNEKASEAMKTEPIVYRTITYAEWLAEGRAKFGPPGKWAFVCPVCKTVQTVDELRAAGVPDNSWAFSCIGRWLPKSTQAFSDSKGPCNYAGGGLFRLNPVTVTREDGTTTQVFEWAPQDGEVRPCVSTGG